MVYSRRVASHATQESNLTVDEELNVLEESVRRLKIEYDVFFGGGSKKPPSDTEWRVQNLIRKYSDSAKLSFPQRFKYNGIAQRYALFSDLWRQKMKIKEEGYRRPQDAVLGISGHAARGRAGCRRGAGSWRHRASRSGSTAPTSRATWRPSSRSSTP